MFARNNITVKAHIVSLLVSFVKVFKIGDKHNNVAKKSTAPFAVFHPFIIN